MNILNNEILNQINIILWGTEERIDDKSRWYKEMFKFK